MPSAINMNIEEHSRPLLRSGTGLAIKMQPRSKVLDGPELMDAAAYGPSSALKHW
jgi:hypothetical protein